MAFVYSCCFWFSLRLGGIFIGMFSILQALIALIIFCIASQKQQNIKQEISLWMKNINLIYISGFLANFQADPEKYFTYSITITCIYIIVCILYVYGAYVCNNNMMFAFILVELIRLIILSIFVILLLLILKENTMDIGLVIGASVVGGFVLYCQNLMIIKRPIMYTSSVSAYQRFVCSKRKKGRNYVYKIVGMFYLWVCAANLPILINEMEREEKDATIKKLERLLENKYTRFKPGVKNISIDDDDEDLYRPELFIIPGNKISKRAQNNTMSNISYQPSTFLP